ncbi:MAG: dihydrolipoamide dehydrogenase, partial [Alphaproteobacteria bacterium]
LDEVPHLTNETVFDLRERPRHLIVIGAGPIGLEMAQAFRRLGSRVTVLEKFRALPKDDPEIAEIALAALRAEDIGIREGVDITGVTTGAGTIEVKLAAGEGGGDGDTVTGSHLLVATGRTPALEGLALEAAGIAHDAGGIRVDRRLRTTNRRVFAIGDCRQGLQFTHVAGYEAGIVLRNALFHLPAKADYGAVPWVTYTDPEIAHVGLAEAAARARYGDRVRVVRESFAGNDRAQAERATDGLLKLVAVGGRPVGVSVVGTNAGELIQLWALALSRRLKLADIASFIAPYPTLGEISKRAAGATFSDRLFSKRTRAIVRLLQWFG